MKDPYVYEGTSVLINKFGIKDSDKLDRAETDMATIAIDKLKNSDFKLNTIYDCLEIHYRLFEGLYDWAGKPRTINIFKGEKLLGGKSVDYVYADYLNEALNELQKEFEKVEWKALSSKESIEKICYFVSEFWHIHPFREGNTRTSAMMLYFLIKKVGIHINTDFLQKNGKFFRNALVLSCLYSSSKPEYLLGIVKDSTTMKNSKNGKYETIEGFEVEKYSYENHTIEKLETIKKPDDWIK